MKLITAILCVLAFSSVATAQNPDPSKWMCRNLADSGNFAYQGETIFGTQACRPIPQAAIVPTPSRQDVASPVSISGPTTFAYSAPVASNVVPVTSQPSTASATSPAAVGDGKTRVFVTDSQSWETRGGSSAGGNKNG